jgi:hypothetical protein
MRKKKTMTAMAPSTLRHSSLRPSALRPSTLRPARLHLTRRGRIVLFLLVTIPLVVAAFFVVTNGGQATATNEHGSALQYVTVSSGQTLWQIAGDVAPDSDPREVVADIVQLNQLGSGDIQAGQRIAIPAEYSH